MSRIRVLVVDDSRVICRMLSEILASDPEIEVVGIANDGPSALKKVDALSPDVVTLDVEMPGMSGLEVLVEIRKRKKKLPVLMFSALTQHAASITLDALARGATDYVTKPSNTGSLEASIEHVRRELLPKVKGLGSRVAATAVVAPSKRKAASRRVQIVAISSSTGGPNALADLLGALPPLPVPIVITQHMPPVFTTLLAERLANLAKLTVREASDGEPVRPGVAYLAPGDRHLTVVRDGNVAQIKLDDGPQENFCRPAADVMLRSLAKTYGGDVLSVVLTGMGSDGQRGSEALHALGASVLVQDEASSVVWGMPGAVVRAGIADDVLPLPELAQAIHRRVTSQPERIAHAG